MTLLQDQETARLKREKIQGKLSDVMKDRIKGLKEVIECFTDKLEDVGDVVYHKTKNMKLNVEIKRMKREKKIWKKEEERKNREIEAIKAINEDLETKLHEVGERRDEG